MNSYGTFSERGYEIFSATLLSPLRELRQGLFEQVRRMVSYHGESEEEFFNGFHRYGLTGAELNRVRLAAVNYFTQTKAAREIFRAVEEPLVRLLGPDIAVQKTCNVVVQQPGDTDQAPIHRDAPSNSHFELIAWIPLVDVYKTKGMFVLNREHSSRALAKLKRGESFQDFCAYTKEHSEPIEVSFGSVCLIQSGLAHGVPLNEESQTRWSLNVRFKNLFSPYGDKGLGDFFEVLQLSPLSKIAFEFSRQEFEPFEP